MRMPPVKAAQWEHPTTRRMLRLVLRRPQVWFAITVLSPTLLWYCLFAFFPILRGLWLTVFDYDFTTRTPHGFVGLTNFRDLFANPLFFIAVQNTILLGVLQFIWILPIGFFISYCLFNIKRGANFYEAMIFLPVICSLVAISLLFKMLMDPQVGTFNAILSSLNLPTSGWLSSSDSALPSIAGILTWKNLGFYVLLITAGMLNIPAELIEAARVDGANEWQRFWQIILPLMGNTLLLVTVLLGISALQEYTAVAVLPARPGGPGTATYVLNLLIVHEAFDNLHLGTAACAALLQFIAIFVISVIQLKLLRPDWSY